MLEAYTFLAQIPEDTLLDKQKTVLNKFAINRHVIYFISDGYHTKIGQAWNVFERLKSLQTGNPRRLILIAAIDCTKSDVNEYEKYVHEYFKDKKIRGEWFFLTDSDIYENCPLGGSIKFPDYFCDKFWHGFYKDTKDIQRNINDRIKNNYCKKPYYT